MTFLLVNYKNIVSNEAKRHLLDSAICRGYPIRQGRSAVLTHYQTTNFRLFQTERVCRRQFQIRRKWQKAIQAGRKHCGKRRNCSLRAISPFPTVFSACFQGASKGVIVWEWVKGFIHDNCYVHTQFYLALYMCVFILNGFPCGYF